MNYYPFHIGDYASATRHLSWDEDAAYRRLLDIAYTTERPLPIDRAAIYRLVVAVTQVQRDAVDVVLAEFFVSTGDGFVQPRVMDELRIARSKIEATEERGGNVQGRKRRYRERRSSMFAELRALGVVPAWDTPMLELQSLYDQHINDLRDAGTAPGTPGTGPGTSQGPFQAVQGNGYTKTKTKTKTKEEHQRASRESSRSKPATKPEGVPDQLWSDYTALRKEKRAPLTQTAMDAIGSEARKAGITLEAALRECCSRGWAFFKADWLDNKGAAGSRSAPPNRLTRAAETMLRPLRGAAQSNDAEVIDGEP